MTEQPPDLRGRILAWIDAEEKRISGHWTSRYPKMLLALRGEVERHYPLESTRPDEPYCHGCMGALSLWPCPVLGRIASQLGVEP